MYNRGIQKFKHLVIVDGGEIVGAGLWLPGHFYYVDSVNGVDTHEGTSWATALKTIAAAVLKAVAGDTIYIKGSFTEAVTVEVAGVSIIGVGTGPKQAQWGAAADAVCLTLAANYCLVENIYFKPPVYAASRVTSAITLSSANYAKIRGCRFQGQTGSQIAIYSPVCNSDNVEITDCDFMYMNTATYGYAILGVEAGGLSYSAWKILRNRFCSCVNGININGRACLIADNVFNDSGVTAAGVIGTVLVLGIDLSGTSSGANSVTRNTLCGAYTATLWVKGASGDNWMGNFAAITVTTAPNGLSVLPAA